ncbi:MAG: hypothetical protein NTV97_29730 [Alphaproteobacteria bacterium]|nr:hypothetical protein [Alphaproteobacteria bacterium]
MKRLMATLLLLLPIALCAALPAHSQGQWTEYSPAGLGYRVQFPGTPKQSQGTTQTSVGPLRVTVATLEAAGGISYLTSSAIYPGAALYDDPQYAITKARSGGLRNVRGKLRVEERLTVSGAPARRVIVDVPRRKQVYIGLFVLSGDRLYQAMIGVPAGQENAPEVNRFLGSLALTGGASVSR